MVDLEEFVRRLTADLRTANAEFIVEIIATPEFVTELETPAPVKRDLAERGYEIPKLRPISVSVGCPPDPARTLLFSFGVDGGSDDEAIVGALDHVQDVVSEETKDPWPACPDHYHWLDPANIDGVVHWVCPDSDRVVARFGELADAPAAGSTG